jgi:hypothetical protein
LAQEPSRFYPSAECPIRLDGIMEAEAACYGVPSGWIGGQVHMRSNSICVQLRDLRAGDLFREHLG